MEDKYDVYIKELHARDYSIYDDVEEEDAALKELHQQSYMILSEGDTVELLAEYYEEFDRLAHSVSFVTLSWFNRTQDLFENKKHVTKEISVKSLKKDKAELRIKEKEEKKKSMLGEIVAMLEVYAEDKCKSHVFHININDCVRHAIANYDPLSKSFILLKGSFLAREVSASYRYSSSEIMRRNLIKNYCMEGFFGYYLKKDIVCKSPDQAASYVLGYFANGLEEWADDKGRTFAKIYNTN